MSNCIGTKNMLSVAVRFSIDIVRGILGCVFLWLWISLWLSYWLFEYLSIVKELFDIVSRAVNVYRDKVPIPQLEQINTTIEHNRINLFDDVSLKAGNIAIAIASQNVNSAVHFLLCKNMISEVCYD